MLSCVTNEIHDSVFGDSPPEELDDVLGKARELVEVDLPKHWDWLIVPLRIDIEVTEKDGNFWEKTAYETS